VRPLLPRPVDVEDDLAGFDCGTAVLDEWLVARALHNEKNGDSRTYVSIDEDSGAVVGYYSLAAWNIAHQEIGGGWLRRNAPDPVSVILLGRLAVSIDAQGLGLGCDLLSDALRIARTASQMLGARALVAEALDDDAARFYAHQGLWRSSVRPDLFAARL